MSEIYRVLCFPGRRLQIDSAEKWGEKYTHCRLPQRKVDTNHKFSYRESKKS